MNSVVRFVVSYPIPMRFLHTTLLLLASATLTQAKIPNFALLDHEGRFHEFDYLCKTPDTKGILIFVQGNGCPLVQKRIPELKRLRDTYGKQGIQFLMLNANLQDEREEIQAEVKTYEIDFPVLIDDAQVMARKLGLTRTAEALLIDAKTQEIVYRLNLLAEAGE